MKVYPNYYPSFVCTADQCRHNCCIGWEIDIDEDTLSYYDMLDGALGAKLRSSIRREDGCACFILDEKERCPFLREDNLCEIILSLGEEALSDICTDHPRFRHFFSDRTELGLGLACESAASLILSFQEKMTLITEDGSKASDETDAFYQRRAAFFLTAQKREWSLSRRMQKMLSDGGVCLPAKSFAEWAKFYRTLERMDSSFDCIIDRIASLSSDEGAQRDDDLLFEQLLVYFLYRHGTPDNESEALAFAVHATCLLRALAAQDSLSFEETVDLCRLYSSEIEYSEENTDALMAFLQNR